MEVGRRRGGLQHGAGVVPGLADVPRRTTLLNDGLAGLRRDGHHDRRGRRRRAVAVASGLRPLAGRLRLVRQHAMSAPEDQKPTISTIFAAEKTAKQCSDSSTFCFSGSSATP